jgi:2-polyprenylphenol 6-hydroxylase
VRLIAWDIRTFALTRASEKIFRNLGVWDKLMRVHPFSDMHVWDIQGSIHFDCTQLAEPSLGYIAEQKVLQTALNERLQQFENVSIFRPAHIQQVMQQQRTVQVTLSTGEHLQARLLVGAEGANSALRTLVGIPFRLQDYAQQAIIANVQTECSHQNTAWQRFLRTGPLAFLPLYDPQHCSIVWSADTPVAQNLMRLSDEAFLDTLSESFAHRLGQVTATSPRLLFPLQRRTAETYIKPRIALVGDAAHTVHPLAGQGVNLGLLDVAALSDVILHADKMRQDIGLYATLKRYERWRKTHNLLVANAMSGFKSLFGSQLPIVQWARNVGLQFTDTATPVKHLLMRHTMGLSGDLPALAQ